MALWGSVGTIDLSWPQIKQPRLSPTHSPGLTTFSLQSVVGSHSQNWTWHMPTIRLKLMKTPSNWLWSIHWKGFTVTTDYPSALHQPQWYFRGSSRVFCRGSLMSWTTYSSRGSPTKSTYATWKKCCRVWRRQRYAWNVAMYLHAPISRISGTFHFVEGFTTNWQEGQSYPECTSPNWPDTAKVILGTHKLLLQVSAKYCWYSFTFIQAATEEGAVEVGKGATKAFETAKSQLTTDHILVHYDPSKPVRFWCGDFSQVT